MSRIDYTTGDYKGFKLLMIDALQERLPDYTDTSETDAGMVILETVAKALDVLSYYQNAQANECFLTTAQLRPNLLKWCKMLGYTPKPSTPAKFKQYFVFDANQGVVTLPEGFIVRTSEPIISNAVYFTTLEELKVDTTSPLDTTQKGYVKTISDTSSEQYIFEVDVAQGNLISGEEVGVGDGITMGLRYTLRNNPVSLPDYDENGFALLPRVNELTNVIEYPDNYDKARHFSLTVGGEEWVMKSSFIDSMSKDKHYTVEVNQDNTVTIIFGDGVNGAIPKGEIVANYRNGGGTVGNVGAETITVINTSTKGLSQTYNIDTAYSLGVDKESNSSIVLNAPNAYRTKWGCLSAEDYADKAMELFNQIMMSSSFPISENTDIDLSTLEVLQGITDETEKKNKLLDTVQVCVLLKNSKIRDDLGNILKLADYPKLENSDIVAELKEMYEASGLIGTFVEITPFTSKDVAFNCTLLPLAGYDFNTVKGQVIDKLKDYFLLGEIQAGQTVAINDVEADVFAAITGIRAFRINSFSVKGVNDTSLDITSNKWEIIEFDAENTVITDNRG